MLTRFDSEVLEISKQPRLRRLRVGANRFLRGGQVETREIHLGDLRAETVHDADTLGKLAAIVAHARREADNVSPR